MKKHNGKNANTISHFCFVQTCIFQLLFFSFFALVLFASPGLAFFNPIVCTMSPLFKM